MRLNDDDFLSVLNFLERSDLETVSISADSTHTTVTANSGRLPLRHIHYAKAVAGKMEMSFERRHNGERQLDTFTVARMEDFIQRLRGSYTKSVLIVGYELWEDRVRFVIDASSDWRAESLTFIQASFHISLQPRQGQPPLLSEMLTKINGLKNIDDGASYFAQNVLANGIVTECALRGVTNMTLCRSDKDLDIDYDDNDVLTFCNRATNNSTDRRIEWAGARISTDFLTKFVKARIEGILVQDISISLGTQQNINVDFPTKAAEYMHLVSTNTRSRSFYDFQASEMRIKFNKKRGTKIQCGSYYRKFISSQDSD